MKKQFNLALISVALVLAITTEARPSFPSNESFYGLKVEDTKNRFSSQIEAAREIKKSSKMENTEYDLQILDLIQRFSENVFSILKNPWNLDPYLSMIDDATFTYAKFLMDSTIR